MFLKAWYFLLYPSLIDEKTSSSAFRIKTLLTFFNHPRLILQGLNIEKYLSMIENSQQKMEIDEDKLNFFISKVSIWEHFGITKNSYLSSTVDEKETMVKRYYSELYQKYYAAVKDLSFFHSGQGKKKFFWISLF